MRQQNLSQCVCMLFFLPYIALDFVFRQVNRIVICIRIRVGQTYKLNSSTWRCLRIEDWRLAFYFYSIQTFNRHSTSRARTFLARDKAFLSLFLLYFYFHMKTWEYCFPLKIVLLIPIMDSRCKTEKEK